jgi:hypothetical protein
MQYKQKVKTIVVAALFVYNISLSTAIAQESANTTGGNASGSGGSVSYSVGQVAYQTHTGTSGSVAEGLQQAYEISVVTSSEKITLIGIDIQAYPNPATDFLILSVESKMNQHVESFAYELLDINGRVLEKKNISASHTNIQMGHLIPATYFLKVYHAAPATSFRQSSSVQTKTFKIIKK